MVPVFSGQQALREVEPPPNQILGHVLIRDGLQPPFVGMDKVPDDKVEALAHHGEVDEAAGVQMVQDGLASEYEPGGEHVGQRDHLLAGFDVYWDRHFLGMCNRGMVGHE